MEYLRYSIHLNSKNSQIIQFKNGQWIQTEFFKEKYTIDQQLHEKILSITSHLGNANQNHNEISP